LDGKAFHTFTRLCARPFDPELMETMDLTAKRLCEEIQGTAFAYVQSDEISLLLTDFKKLGTSAWFDGNIQKITSVSASIATSAFNETFPDGNAQSALFDSRVFTIPDPIEVENYFIWRQQDAVRNSVQMVAQSLYSHKELHKKGSNELQEMIFQKGKNWNDYTSREKRGGFVDKVTRVLEGLCDQSSIRNNWELIDCPTFTQDRYFLRNRIPRIGLDDEQTM
jgi:tRNA(His) 5'-end guanylyltransferase